MALHSWTGPLGNMVCTVCGARLVSLPQNVLLVDHDKTGKRAFWTCDPERDAVDAAKTKEV